MGGILQLRTLGALGVERDGAPVAGSAARRRPLAFLAFVALHGDAGVSREAALGRFWPDGDDARARNNLKQTVFGLRRDFGADVLGQSPTVLRVDRAQLAVDALDFREAIEREDPAAAVALYRGPFLDGLAIPGLDEFETWVLAERDRLARECGRALEAVADQARRRRDLGGAVEAWRRYAAIDPLSGRAAAGLMRALRDAGDHTAALEHWRIHEIIVRQELDAAPEPEVGILAAELRRAVDSASRVQNVAPTEATPPVASGGVVARFVAAPAARSGGAVTVVNGVARDPRREISVSREFPVPATPRRPRRWLRGALLVALGTAAAAVVVAPVASRRYAAARATRPDSVAAPDAPAATLVAVMPFAVRGQHGDSMRLGVATADLVGIALHGAGPVRSVPPATLQPVVAAASRDGLSATEAAEVARRFGAGRFVVGEVVRDGARLQAAASLHDGAGRVLAQASAAGSVGRLGALAEQLSLALIAQQFVLPAGRLASVAVTSTSSLAAVKAWLAGEDAYAQHRYADAASAFSRAVAADPRFALALYRLANALDLLGDLPGADVAAARASALGARLPTAERELLLAWRDARAGRVADAEERYEALLDDEPTHLEGWFRLAELRFHANPGRGVSVTESRRAFERVLELDPGHVEALVYLARIASLQDRLHDADSLLARARAISLDGHTLELRAVRTFALGEGLLQQRALRALLKDPPNAAAARAIDVAIYRDDVGGADAFATTLLRAEPSREVRALAFRLHALAAAAHGQVAAAEVALDSIVALDANAAIGLRALLRAQPFLRGDAGALRDAAARLDAWRPPPGPETATLVALRHHSRGLVAAAAGDDATLARELAVLRTLERDAATRPAAAPLAASLAARVALRAGRAGEALRLLEDAPPIPLAPRLITTEVANRFLHAEVLHALGRDSEAAGWYAAIAERSVFELPWLAPAQLRLGEIREHLGDRDGALRHYRRVLTLWASSDPAVRPTTDDVARRVARLEARTRPRTRAR